MASENYVQPSIPRFDGHHYDHWSMLMENFLRSKEYWTVVEGGVPEPTAGANDAQRAEIEKEKLKDLKAKNYLFQSIDRAILEIILNKSTSKNIWDSMKKKTMAIANKMRIHGENLEDVAIVEKILQSMTTKFNYVVCSIEKSNNIEALDELQNSLLVHEWKINRQDKQEQAVQISQTQALQTTVNSRAVGRGKEIWKGRPRSDNRSKSAGKANIECFRCHKYGHYRSECRVNLNRGESSNFAEHNEKNDDSSLFMVCLPKEVNKKNVWYLDTGCNNHMCGDKSAFSDLDESCQDKVKFGDNSIIAVKGKGKGKVTIHAKDNSIQTMSNVLYVPDLKSNLLSLGQLQEKGYEILIKDGVCKFDTAWLWHCRFGHLYFGGLKALQQKKMVNGLPHFDSPLEICEICVTKLEALAAFKNFKVLAENEVGRSIKVLWIDHGGEFNSKEFADFCEFNDIKRQLTVAYTPQQNGVYEKRNRTIMNMVRSLMSKSSLPKEFWPEAVNWSVHILNRTYAYVPDQKRSKLDDKGEKCIFLGVSDQSKAYRLYNPLTKKVIISRDVVFDEASTWSWTKKSGQQIPADFENGEDLTMQNSEGQTSTDLEVSRQTVEEILPTEVEFSTEGSLPATPKMESGTSSRPQRKNRRPTWLEDYEVTDLPQDDVPVNHFALFVDYDPLTYEEAVKEEKWQKAMAEEIGSIERNQTWELTDLPKGHKTIGVKKKEAPLSFSMLWRFFLLALIASVGQMIYLTGIKFSSPTLSSAIVNLTPIFTFLLAIMFRMEKVDFRRSSSQAKVLGAIVSVTGALATAAVKAYPDEMTIVFFFTFFITVQAAVFALILERNPAAWRLKSSVEIIAIMSTAILGSLFWIAIHTWCLRKKGPVYVVMFKPLGIAIAVVMTVTFLGEILHLGGVIGSIIITVGFYAVMWGKRKEKNMGLQNENSTMESSGPKTPLLQSSEMV
ncbi:hypothetical protein SLEP1_g10137 [Rubroshorea leprosula]|uniref:WAT1-related protein n=1 Tax=Rubroshorea leprosula TaxID=152421 RepID=A0AAV5IBP0_9ROSI|nr:hypothetical protein SLEP1_g10137 [Rubroshorea leprosula]